MARPGLPGQKSDNVCGPQALPLWFPPLLPLLLAHFLPRSETSLLSSSNRSFRSLKAAGLNNQHEDTFRRNFPHLIRKIGKRKTGVKLRDAITLPPAPYAA